MLIFLRCATQNYDWGKIGNKGLVGQLSALNGNYVNSALPYAELWIGTHQSSPSLLKSSGETLEQFIKSNPNCLGFKLIQNFGVKLPFLLKVLSIEKPLSIQVHPDKEMARHLHKTQPSLYKDSNHKPEIAIALTEFEVLVGFRPCEEIVGFTQKCSELFEIFNDHNISFLKEDKNENKTNNAIKYYFEILMKYPEGKISVLLENFKKRILMMNKMEKDNLLGDLFLRIYNHFPGDIGCFAIYFLNYICLKPGEAIFIAANEPHAYLKGECIECMACSDNVIRAGLTPKYKDVDLLFKILNYKELNVNDILYCGVSTNAYITLYKPPVAEFCIAKIEIPLKNDKFTLPGIESPSLFIVIKGEGVINNHTKISEGSIFFLGANEHLQIGSDSHLLVFRASLNIFD